MKIILGSDHAGFDLKEAIKVHLEKLGNEIIDKGTYSKERANYAEFGHKVGLAIANKEGDFGIIVCGTGIGISIAANRHKGARAARCLSVDDAKITRLHNNANILALGERDTKTPLALKMVDVFLKTKFEGGRHIKRVETLDE